MGEPTWGRSAGKLSFSVREMLRRLFSLPGCEAVEWEFFERTPGSRAQVGSWRRTLWRRGFIERIHGDTIRLTQAGREAAHALAAAGAASPRSDER